MQNKKLILALIALVAVVALFLTVYFVTRPKTEDGSKTFTLTIVHGDGSSKELSITSSEEYLAPALIAEGILTDEGVQTGMYNSVDGETADWDVDHAYWSFYVGQEYATLGMNDTPIQDGASYKLEYVISDYGG